MGFRVIGVSGVQADVTAANQIKVITETNTSLPGNIGCVRMVSENDAGTISGAAQLYSPETDLDYRIRTASDVYLDQEIFNYTAQNTGKHTYTPTTMSIVWNAGAMLTNGAGITTVTTGVKFNSYNFFPITGTSTLALDLEGSFNTTPVANTVIDFGFFLPGAANPYAPTDGVYFRLTSAGLFGIVNNNGIETSTAVMAFTVVPNKKYQFLVYIHQRIAEFWINDGASTDIYGTISTPDGNGQPCMSAALPVAIRHAITGGTAGANLQFSVASYNVRLGGPNVPQSMGELGNACYGAYQGLSGGTMGTLANYANSANPTAAVPTNTTAALGTGLGGQFWETDTLAVTTDGIISSFQVPLGTVNIQGRRLKIVGIDINSFVQTVLTGGGYVASWSLAFGHTNVSLATAEATAAKAARRIPLGLQTVAAAALALTLLATVSVDFKAGPVYVNPGEFIQIVKKKIGTAPSAGVIGHTVTLFYTWE